MSGRELWMARRSFEVVDVTEILVHWDAGRSQSEIATSLGLDRKTVKKYLAPVLEAGLEAADLGVPDGARVFPAPVPAAGAADGPAGLDAVSCGGVSVLRRLPGEGRAGQPENRGPQGRSV